MQGSYLWMLLIPFFLFISLAVTAWVFNATLGNAWWKFPLWMVFGLCVTLPACFFSVVIPLSLTGMGPR